MTWESREPEIGALRASYEAEFSEAAFQGDG